jgi:AcrR family transcriptional regulator
MAGRADKRGAEAPAHRAKPRDRAETERRILAAVGETLAENGFRALGVNAIAKRAGVDKVLIYRYFGGLAELLASYAEHGDFWYRYEDIAGPLQPPATPDTPGAWMALALRRHVAWLRSRPVTLEIMAWETIERNELTAALARVREERGLAIMERIAARFAMPARTDLAALVALFAAATNYLLIRARGIRKFQGLDLRRDADWDRLFAAIGAATDAIMGDKR